MHQSPTPSLSLTIWKRWAWSQFLSFPIDQTLLPVTFGYSPSSEAVVMRTIEEMKEAVTKVIDALTQKDFHAAFQKLLERYNKCIAAGGDYFEGGLEFHVCTINKSCPYEKSLENLFNDPRSVLNRRRQCNKILVRRKGQYIASYLKGNERKRASFLFTKFG